MGISGAIKELINIRFNYEGNFGSACVFKLMQNDATVHFQSLIAAVQGCGAAQVWFAYKLGPKAAGVDYPRLGEDLLQPYSKNVVLTVKAHEPDQP
jgi:hypothetical protein